MTSKDQKLTILLLSLSILLIECSGKKDVSQHQAPQTDSANTHEFGSPAVTTAGPVSLTYEQKQGKFLYTKYCSICHGAEGKGDGFNAFNLDPKPRDFTDKKYMNALNDPRLVETVTEGGRGVNRSPYMPTWGGRLTRQEIEYLVDYIRLFSK